MEFQILDTVAVKFNVYCLGTYRRFSDVNLRLLSCPSFRKLEKTR